MKKFFRYALLFAAAGVMSTGFTACSDDDDNNERVSIPAATFDTAFDNYINNIVNANYEDLQTAAEQLHVACANLYAKKQAGQVEQSDIDAACAAFKVARRYWEQSEAFLYGPATDDGLDPHTDSWPLDQTEMADALTNPSVIAGITGENPAKYVNDNNDQFQSTLGYHGLEFVLFRNGQNRTAAAFNAEYEDAEGLNRLSSDNTANAAKLRTVTMLQEAAFANAVSADLRNATKLLAYEWDGSATLKDYISQNASWYWDRSIYTTGANHDFTAGACYSARVNGIGSGFLFSSWQSNLSNVLLGGCQNICQEVHTQKLGQAYRVAIGHPEQGEEGEDAADYIESPYSKRSFIDYLDNIYGIRNVLYGVRGTRDAAVNDEESSVTPASNSFMAILNRYYPEASSLNSALNNAITTLNHARLSDHKFIDAPDDPQVKACMDAVEALDNALSAAASWVTANVDVAN